MSEHERGAYTPPTDSAPLAFEARQPVRGARPFPLTLIVSVLVLLGLAAAIFVFYRQGIRQAAGPPQVVGTPVGGLKAAAPPDAQPQDPAAGLEIYRSENGQQQPQMVPTPPKFTPPPEQPQARPQGGPPVVVTPPAQASAPPAAAPPAAPVAQQALRPAQNPPPPAQVAAQPAPKPAVPTRMAAATPPPKAAAPAPKPAAEKPKVEKPPEKTTEKAAAPATKPGAAAVQIGAVSSTQLADKTWTDAVAVAPGLAAGKGKGVEKVDRDGKVLYRTSVTGFASKAEAAAFCDKLKAAGKACFVK